ncbi:MAG: hypothetical protein K2L49_06705 [Muribaculaceae bacterium]|nr:hypothetical protein [Muribaculaceae bacterium]
MPSRLSRGLLSAIVIALLFPHDLLAISQLSDSIPVPATIPLSEPLHQPSAIVEDEITVDGDSVSFTPVDTIPVKIADTIIAFGDTIPVATQDETEIQREFNPDPTRAVWLSALFPGLGQIYNRRYWKLPIVVGGFMGLGYATSWNNGMLDDYTRAYRDLMDSDPSTRSYMNLFPSTTREEDLDKTWLENVLRSRKNYFRRNRDLCIICIIGVYLIAMVDAYVDASLSHFDISPDLSMDWAPTLIPSNYGRGFKPSVGLQWAFRF